jgi:hypothetical protein
MTATATSIAAGLMAWAANSMGLPVPDHLPTIEFQDQCAIERSFFRDPAHECGGKLKVMAIYVSGEDRVILSDDWNPDSLKDQSILLHELVHFVQDEAGVQDHVQSYGLCVGQEIEAPAYAAQFAWLRSKSANPWTVLALDPLTLAMITRCQNPWEIVGGIAPR